MISFVIISKDEPSLDGTLTAVAGRRFLIGRVHDFRATIYSPRPVTVSQAYDAFLDWWLKRNDFFVLGQRFDLSGTRLALWTAGLVVVAAALNTRRLLKRYRLSRPVPLTLVPKHSRLDSHAVYVGISARRIDGLPD